MSNNNSTPTNQEQAVRNEFNTYMTLRDQGVSSDNAFRAADHVRRATNEAGEAGAARAAVQVIRWLGLFAAIIVAIVLISQVANANTVHLPYATTAGDRRVSPTAWAATPTPELAPPPVAPTIAGGAQ